MAVLLEAARCAATAVESSAKRPSPLSREPQAATVSTRQSGSTSRTKQDTDLGWDAGAPGVRVFATRGLAP